MTEFPVSSVRGFSPAPVLIDGVLNRPIVSLASVLERVSPDASGYARPGPPGSNALGRIRILLLGGEASGKSTTAEAVASFYSALGLGDGKFLVQSGGVAELFRKEHLSGSSVPLWVLVAEDMTLAEIPREDRVRWFQIRHIVRKATGFSRGLVVSVTNVHTFYGLDKDLRTEFEALIIKSVPTNRNDRSMLRTLLGGGTAATAKTVGESYIHWLEQKTLSTIRNPSDVRFALVWTRDRAVSYVEIPLVTPLLVDITPVPHFVNGRFAVLGFVAFIIWYAALMLWVIVH